MDRTRTFFPAGCGRAGFQLVHPDAFFPGLVMFIFVVSASELDDEIIVDQSNESRVLAVRQPGTCFLLDNGITSYNGIDIASLAPMVMYPVDKIGGDRPHAGLLHHHALGSSQPLPFDTVGKHSVPGSLAVCGMLPSPAIYELVDLGEYTDLCKTTSILFRYGYTLQANPPGPDPHFLLEHVMLQTDGFYLCVGSATRHAIMVDCARQVFYDPAEQCLDYSIPFFALNTKTLASAGIISLCHARRLVSIPSIPSIVSIPSIMMSIPSIVSIPSIPFIP